MTGLDEQPDDATPLTPEEREGLIPSHIAIRRELNELEQQNIIEANSWAFSRKRNPASEAFGRGLHRRMFGKVWRWAGTYRTSDKNLGVECWQICAPFSTSQEAYHGRLQSSGSYLRTAVRFPIWMGGASPQKQEAHILGP